MNLLCPNCQKMLTVPEQFAGQLMKCPLCSGTFTVPALPAGGSDPAVPMPPPLPPEPDYQPQLHSEPDPVYRLADLPTSPPPVAPSSAAPEPAFFSTPSSQIDPKPYNPTPSAPASAPSSTPSAPSLGTTTGAYTRCLSLSANVAVLQWVPLVALVLIFFLQFFPWVGVYPGGVAAVTQNAWQAAFGGYTQDPDIKVFRILEKEEVDKINAEKSRGYTEISNAPGVSLLTLFYLLPIFLVTLAFTIFLAVHPYLHNVQLPPQVMQLLPLKWQILSMLNILLLLLLGFQMLLGFSLERSITDWVDNKPEFKRDAKDETRVQKEKEAGRGNWLGSLRRTIWLRLTLLFQLAATGSALLVYWVERRGPNKPLPIIELRW